MLHVLNAKERNHAFGRFLLLFLLSIVMVIIAVYFNWQMPVKTNAILTNKLGDYQMQEIEQQKYIAVMDSAKTLLDSLEKPGANVTYYNMLIETQLGKLKEMTSQSQAYNVFTDIDKRILICFLNYYDAKKQLLGFKDANKQISDLTDQLKQCQVERERDRNELQIYRRPG